MRNVRSTSLSVDLTMNPGSRTLELDLTVYYDDHTVEGLKRYLEPDDVEGWTDMHDLARQLLVSLVEKL